jgi:hypothetical protein
MITNQIHGELDSCSKSKLRNAYTDLTFERMSQEDIDSILSRLWSDGYYQYIASLGFKECPIRSIPKVVSDFRSLYAIEFKKCDSITTMNGFNEFRRSNFELSFIDCKIKELPNGVENLAPMIQLKIICPYDYADFDLDKELSKFSKRKNINKLFIYYNKLAQFPESIFNLTSLRYLYFYSNNIKYYPLEFDKLVNLVYVDISSEDDRVEENIKKSTVLKYYSRLYCLWDPRKSGEDDLPIGRSDGLNCFYAFLPFSEKFSPSDLHNPLTVDVGGQEVQTTECSVNGQRSTKIEFLEAEKDDKLKVILIDRDNNVLSDAEIKNKVAYVDLSKCERGVYYLLKININYMSKTFVVRL